MNTKMNRSESAQKSPVETLECQGALRLELGDAQLDEVSGGSVNWSIMLKFKWTW